jgi:hypothetical protein
VGLKFQAVVVGDGDVRYVDIAGATTQQLLESVRSACSTCEDFVRIIAMDGLTSYDLYTVHQGWVVTDPLTSDRIVASKAR